MNEEILFQELKGKRFKYIGWAGVILAVVGIVWIVLQETNDLGGGGLPMLLVLLPFITIPVATLPKYFSVTLTQSFLKVGLDKIPVSELSKPVLLKSELPDGVAQRAYSIFPQRESAEVRYVNRSPKKAWKAGELQSLVGVYNKEGQLLVVSVYRAETLRDALNTLL